MRRDIEGTEGDGSPPGRSPHHARIPRPHRGRPSRLSPEVHDRMVGYIRVGVLFKDAAAACGIAEATAHEWVARGEGTDPDRPPAREYVAFARDIREAAAGPMVVASNWLFTNKPDVWLARRDPAAWGPGGHASHGLDGGITD